MWLERVRIVYELISQKVPVVLSDLDAVWVRNPLPYILGAARSEDQGFDLVTSRGSFPLSNVFKTVQVAGGLVV